MGIAFITAKAENFQHQKDEAFEEQFNAENLFSALPDSIKPTYRCMACVEDLPEVGAGVLLHHSGNEIVVLCLNRQIGTVMSPDAAELVGLMQGRHTQALAGQISEHRPLTGIFSVRLNSSKS